jgi:hypothetical protein
VRPLPRPQFRHTCCEQPAVGHKLTCNRGERHPEGG